MVDTLLAQNRQVMPRAPKAVARNLRLENVAVDIGPDVWLRSSEANIKLGGSLNVTLAPPTPSEPPRLALEGASADREPIDSISSIRSYSRPSTCRAEICGSSGLPI